MFAAKVIVRGPVTVTECPRSPPPEITWTKGNPAVGMMSDGVVRLALQPRVPGQPLLQSTVWPNGPAVLGEIVFAVANASLANASVSFPRMLPATAGGATWVSVASSDSDSFVSGFTGSTAQAPSHPTTDVIASSLILILFLFVYGGHMPRFAICARSNEPSMGNTSSAHSQFVIRRIRKEPHGRTHVPNRPYSELRTSIGLGSNLARPDIPARACSALERWTES